MRFYTGLLLSRVGKLITRFGWWIGGKESIMRHELRQRVAKRARAVKSARTQEAWWQLLAMSEAEFERFLDGVRIADA